jgi:hypothetical protein
MDGAQARFEDEIAFVESEIEVIPRLIVGPMGDFCGGCWEEDACTVLVRWVGAIDGVEHEFEVALHRGCAVEWIARSAIYCPAMVVELGLYQGVDFVPEPEQDTAPAAVDPELPPCEQED